MSMLNIITFSILITLTSSADKDTVRFEINFSKIRDELMELNDFLFGSEGTKTNSKSGTIQISEENYSSDSEELKEKDQRRYSGTALNSSEMDALQVSFQGLKSVAAAMKKLRRANVMQQGSSQQSEGFDEEQESGDNTLMSLIELNKKRNELISKFNNKFPGILDNSNARRINYDIEQPKVMVELSPGSIKTEIVTYPPNYLASKMKYLLKLKEKQQA